MPFEEIFIIIQPVILVLSKGQIKPKVDWHATDSPKKRTNKFGFFAIAVRKYMKKQIRSFVFLEDLRRANLLSVLSDL